MRFFSYFFLSLPLLNFWWSNRLRVSKFEYPDSHTPITKTVTHSRQFNNQKKRKKKNGSIRVSLMCTLNEIKKEKIKFTTKKNILFENILFFLQSMKSINRIYWLIHWSSIRMIFYFFKNCFVTFFYYVKIYYLPLSSQSSSFCPLNQKKNLFLTYSSTV